MSDTIEELRCVIEDLTRQVREAREERDAMLADIKRLIGERDGWFADLDSVAASLGVETTRQRILQTIERVRGDIKRKDNAYAEAVNERDALRLRVEAMQEAMLANQADLDDERRRAGQEPLDAVRYRRLRILGVPKTTKDSEMLCFTNLDAFVDRDIKVQASKGEARYPEEWSDAPSEMVGLDGRSPARLSDIDPLAEAWGTVNAGILRSAFDENKPDEGHCTRHPDAGLMAGGPGFGWCNACGWRVVIPPASPVAPVPLTVAAALALPEVRSGARHVEYVDAMLNCRIRIRVKQVTYALGVVGEFEYNDEVTNWSDAAWAHAALSTNDLDAPCTLVDPTPTPGSVPNQEK